MGCIPPACWPYVPACTALGGCLLQGVPGPRGCLVPGGCVLPGVCSREGTWSQGDGIPACTGADPPVNRILDTRYWKYYLAPNFVKIKILIRVEKTLGSLCKLSYCQPSWMSLLEITKIATMSLLFDRKLQQKPTPPILFLFKNICGGGDISPFYKTTDITVSNFWWYLPWVSKPG